MKDKALINSVPSWTALACSMLYIFYPKDILTGKRLKNLDTRAVGAIAGKYVEVTKASLELGEQ